MKKLFVILILGVFLMGNISAGLLDIKKEFTELDSFTLNTKVIEYNTLWEKYPPIEIESWLGLGSVIFSGAIVEHTDTCGEDCFSTMEVYLANDGILIDDIKFYTINGEEKYEQEIKNYHLEYWGIINDYETICNLEETIIESNGTTYTPQKCNEILMGDHEGWINYNIGEEMLSGEYTIKLLGEKKPSRTVDWVIKTNGETLNSWAVWGNITEGDDAGVILNVPEDGAITYNPEVKFNFSSNITGGSHLINYSLWTNETGIWNKYNETDFSLIPITRVTTLSADALQDSLSANTHLGIKITVGSSDTTLKNVTKFTGGTDTHAYLQSTDTSILASSAFVGENATFDYTLSAGVTYYITVTNPSATFTVQRDDSFTFPIDMTEVSMVGGIGGNSNPYSEEDARAWAIKSLDLFTSYETDINKTINRTITEDIIWNVQTCDSDGDCGFAPSNFSSFQDTTTPTITIESPISIYDYLYQDYNLTLNTTITDINLNICWSEYNNTNTTFSCSSGTKSNTGFLYEPNFNNITIWANDLVGNQHGNFTSWEVKVQENSRTLNTTSYETKSEIFSINVTANSSLTSIILDYNGTEYSTTKSGTVYSKTLDIPTGVQNRGVRWKFIYAGDSIYSTSSYQNISLLNFSICDTSLTDNFLNISFKDEANLGILNASIPTSTFEYYLGSGTTNKTLTYVNNNLNYNYTFCATPTTETLKINPYFQFKQGTDYPQRIWDADLTEYTSTVTHQTLYLLSSLDGIYVTFQVLSAGNTPLEGTEVTGTRTISDETVEVAQGTTDAAGSVTFWLNPDFSHTFTFIKTGYDSYSTTITPTQSTYTINLGTSTTSTIDYAREISTSVKPLGSYLLNDSTHNFNYTISTSYWTLDKFGFTLSYSNGTIIGTQISTSGVGGTIGLDATTGSNGSIIMAYYYVINSTYTNGTSTWKIYKSNAFSITHLFTRVTTYIDADILGVQSDDEGYFFKAVLSIFVLITLTGILSTRYGIASEQAITGIIFGTLLLLNSLNLIPTPDTLNINLGNFVVFIVGLMTAALIFKEESR